MTGIAENGYWDNGPYEWIMDEWNEACLSEWDLGWIYIVNGWWWMGEFMKGIMEYEWTFMVWRNRTGEHAWDVEHLWDFIYRHIDGIWISIFMGYWWNMNQIWTSYVGENGTLGTNFVYVAPPRDPTFFTTFDMALPTFCFLGLSLLSLLSQISLLSLHRGYHYNNYHHYHYFLIVVVHSIAVVQRPLIIIGTKETDATIMILLYNHLIIMNNITVSLFLLVIIFAIFGFLS